MPPIPIKCIRNIISPILEIDIRNRQIHLKADLAFRWICLLCLVEPTIVARLVFAAAYCFAGR